MASVEFSYNNNQTIIQCDENTKMEDIFKKFETKIGKNIEKLNFLYNGNIFSIQNNKSLTFSQIAKDMDKENLKISVIVYDNDSNIENNELVKSKEIICPECGENSIINIENYKISLFGCKNKHENKDISFFDFDKT